MPLLHCFLVPDQHLLLSEDLSYRIQYELLQTFRSPEQAKLFLDSLCRTYKLPAFWASPVNSDDRSVPVPPPEVSLPKKTSTYRYRPTIDRPGKRRGGPGGWPQIKNYNPLPKGSTRPFISCARHSITTKRMYAASWRLWWTDGERETRIFYPKSQYPTPDDCPPPGPQWRRGRSVAFKRKFMEWKDDWHAALWAGAAERRRR